LPSKIDQSDWLEIESPLNLQGKDLQGKDRGETDLSASIGDRLAQVAGCHCGSDGTEPGAAIDE